MTGGCFYNLFILLGVFLPTVAWGVECYTHICADTFFNPLPTPLHHALWLTVPLSNAWIALVLFRDFPRRTGLGVFSGVAQGVLIAYNILFLPLLPISIFAIAFMGFGFCSLSPLLAVPVTLVAFRKLQPRPRGRLAGVALGLGLLVVSELPEAVTAAGLHLAAGASPQRGLQLLRAHGDHDLMLKACYQKPEWSNSVVGMIASQGSPPDPEECRKIFYRVTGQPFNHFPPPRSAQRFLFDDEVGWEWEWDSDRAGEQVGQRMNAFALGESDLLARVDNTGATAVWTWDLTFANGKSVQREARCQLRLPPGGVVSGAKLWVDGRPRKALIASRAKARQAYEEVVKQKRDPLLVTTNGPERVMVQCFPVPAQGEMRIQLEITAPLLLGGEENYLKPPVILERNFSIDQAHELALECPLPNTGLPADVPARGLGSPELGAWVKGAHYAKVWCADPQGGFTAATWTTPPTPSGPLWIVLDGSASMQPYRADVAAALRAWKGAGQVGVLLAGDEVRTLLPQGAHANLEEAAQAWETAPLVGGQDAAPALLQARGGRVLWVHGAQPALLSDVAPLREHAPHILSLAVTPGPNRVLDELGCPEAVRTGPLSQDFPPRNWLQLSLGHQSTRPEGQASDTADLSRLWAAQECAHGGPEALKLAVKYQLVTPVSGAVVLETKEDEQRAGLRPGDFGEIPVVPEPGSLLLLAALGVVAAGWRLVRR